jgi:hypothetical protein
MGGKTLEGGFEIASVMVQNLSRFPLPNVSGDSLMPVVRPKRLTRCNGGAVGKVVLGGTPQASNTIRDSPEWWTFTVICQSVLGLRCDDE